MYVRGPGPLERTVRSAPLGRAIPLPLTPSHAGRRPPVRMLSDDVAQTDANSISVNSMNSASVHIATDAIKLSRGPHILNVIVDKNRTAVEWIADK